MLVTFRRRFFDRAGWMPVVMAVAVVFVAVVASTSAQTSPKKALLDLADEAFSRTEGTAARKATKFRDEYAAMVESIVAASGIGGTPETDRGGSTAIERLRRASLPAGTHRGKDGTLIEVFPDGIARFTTPDKRIATVLPGGRRFYQATQNSALIAVDSGPRATAAVGDPPPLPESYAKAKDSHIEPRSESEESPRFSGETLDGADERIRDGIDGEADADESVARPDRFGTDRVHRLLDEPGEHASGLPWSNLAEAANAAGGGDESVASDVGGDGGADGESSEIVLRDESPGRDGVVSSSRIPGTGVDVFVRESGATQIRLPDGTVVTSDPDLGYVGVTDGEGREVPVTRRGDGLVQVGEGALGMAVDPDTGRAFILDQTSGGSSAAGQRIVVESNGAYSYTDSESSFQAVRPDNSLDQAGYVDANTGASVQYDADSGETRIYTPEGVVAGISNGSSGVFVNPASGGQLPVGGVLQPPAASGNPAAVSIWSTAQAEPPSQAPRRFPSSEELASQYLATARDMIARNADQARRQGIPQEEIDRIRRELATMETETLVARDLQRLQRIAEARADDFTADADDPALAAIDSQIAAAEAALESARREARTKQDELSKAREEAAAAIREANETVAQGERNLQLFIATNDPSLEKAELAGLEPRVTAAVEAARQAAEGMIDYRKYDRCSNGRSWHECGGVDQQTGEDHDAIKAQWLREQRASAMTRAMGPALAAQEKRVEALKKAIAEKEKKIDQEKKLQQVAKEQAERVLQQQKQKEQQLAEQLKAAEKASEQNIREKDETLHNLRQKRIEVALRPRRPKSDLQEFSDQVFGGTAFGRTPPQGP